MSVYIEKAKPENAAGIIEFMNEVAGETDNLSFGANDFFQQTAEGETAFLEAQAAAGGFTLLALDQVKGGPHIVGIASADRSERQRMVHRAQLAVAVSKSRWGEGIGSRLFETLVLHLENDQSVDVAALWVRCDNERAIRLYERYGFTNDGVERGIMKIGGELVDAYCMSRVFKRDRARDGKPLVYLRDAVDIAEQGNEDWIPLLNTATGEATTDYAGGDYEMMFGEEKLPKHEGPEWIVLPHGRDFDDWGTMRDFAEMQEEGVRDRMLDILHRRGAYGRFKDYADDCGLLDAYFTLRDERHRQTIAEWLEAHDLPWTEGWSFAHRD